MPAHFAPPEAFSTPVPAAPPLMVSVVPAPPALRAAYGSVPVTVSVFTDPSARMIVAEPEHCTQ